MTRLRSLVLSISTLVVVLLLGGGLIVRVGAAESTYRQAVLFAEVLAQVLDNYVDPVDPERLLEGAYEGMLAGLDPNGAYLSPSEVAQWKARREGELVSAGFAILKNGRVVQVVSVDPDSSAAEAGLTVGDQVRSVNGALLAELSLEQSRRLLSGTAGSRLQVEVLHPRDSFRREEVELVRRERRAARYRLDVEQDVAVLRLETLDGLPLDDLVQRLRAVREHGAERLLVDLRGVTEGDARQAPTVAATLFGLEARLRLRDRTGHVMDTVESRAPGTGWSGSVALLVNGATAGGAEALAALLRGAGRGHVYGEATYGLGAETKLYELDNGAALLVSAARWETDAGLGWNDEGLKPDDVVEGSGRDSEEIRADQLRRVLERLRSTAEVGDRQAA